MEVIDGGFPNYVLKCDSVDFEVVWHKVADCWSMVEQYPGELYDLRTHLGVSWDAWQDGVTDAIAEYERRLEIKEKQALIEVVK